MDKVMDDVLATKCRFIVDGEIKAEEQLYDLMPPGGARMYCLMPVFGTEVGFEFDDEVVSELMHKLIYCAELN